MRTSNAFCPTGKGGGIDPTCGPKSSVVTSSEFTREGRSELRGVYRTEGRRFEVWLRHEKGEPHARLSTLKSYGEGKASFKDVLPEFIKHLKAQGIKEITYSTALDEATGGKSRDRLFGMYAKHAQKLLATNAAAPRVKKNYDPTNTTGPRKAFASKVNAQFDSVRRDAGLLIRSMDANAPADQMRDKVRAFRAWLGDTLDRKVLSDGAKDQWGDYLERMYMKGGGTAYSPQDKSLPGRAEFLRVMGKNRANVESLHDQAWEEMTNISTDARVKAGRALAEGLARGDSPRTVAAEVDRQLVKSGKRAETAAHHEAVRAHAEGQLTAFEMMGTEKVTASVEWNTAGDGKVCNLCAPLANLVLTPREARGLIPRHVNCRCSWQAAIGRSTKRQAQRAFASSLKNGPKGSKWKPPVLKSGRRKTRQG